MPLSTSWPPEPAGRSRRSPSRQTPTAPSLPREVRRPTDLLPRVGIRSAAPGACTPPSATATGPRGPGRGGRAPGPEPFSPLQQLPRPGDPPAPGGRGHAALDRYGVGPGAVRRSIAGTMTLHDDLEERLARFEGCARGHCSRASSPTWNHRRAGRRRRRGHSHELNHASIVDGVRLTRRRGRSTTAHPADLERALTEARSAGAKRVLVITDGVFSMDGDIAPSTPSWPWRSPMGPW